MDFMDRNFKEIFAAQLLAIIGFLVAGSLLAFYTEKLLLIPGMLILIPGFLEMRGNISGTLAARLSSGLFLGVIDPTKRKTRAIHGNLLASFILSIVVCLALGLIAFALSFFLFKVYMPKLILMSLIAGFISNLIESPLAVVSTLYFYRKGHDPHNIMGPFVTAVGDVSSIIALLIAMVIV
ncbi:MAG TPA: magnesium transporter [Candidatus Nanoarchaeia archaeon]|nr:magnesium transporter [Candidatus Nanoarchaeia archaeon]